jgi:murein DD-endopeptidase MepM/ murein hydrolase activator NlpD
MLQKAPPARGRDRHSTATHRDRGGQESRLRDIVLALAFVPLLVALLPTAPAGGSIESKLSAARSRLETVRRHEQVLTSDISALSGRIRSLEHEIGGLRRRERKVEARLAVKRAQLLRVKSRYEREHARYLRLRAKLKRAQDVLAQRLVDIYKSDQPDFLSVILNSDGFNDLLERADYMSKIGAQDSAIVDRVRELKQASARKRRLLLELKQAAQQAVDTIAAQAAELQSTRAGIESREQDLAATRRTRQGALATTRTNRRDLEGDVRALEAASAEVTHQLQGTGSVPAGPIRQGSGNFIWPVNGPVVSPFGMRWGRLHAGVDIAVPSGTPIRAAAGGSVAIAGWMGGYGQYTCIQHGGGISTCYGHQSSIGVSVGQTVSQGQVIGSSGCTGHCFGPHVHFEVRVGGTPVDPMGYL